MISLDDSRIQYNINFRTGMAIAALEILERIVKINFPNEYKINKYKIRRLSEYEAHLIIDNLMENKKYKFPL